MAKEIAGTLEEFVKEVEANPEKHADDLEEVRKIRRIQGSGNLSDSDLLSIVYSLEHKKIIDRLKRLGEEEWKFSEKMLEEASRLSYQELDAWRDQKLECEEKGDKRRKYASAIRTIYKQTYMEKRVEEKAKSLGEPIRTIDEILYSKKQNGNELKQVLERMFKEYIGGENGQR